MFSKIIHIFVAMFTYILFMGTSQAMDDTIKKGLLIENGNKEIIESQNGFSMLDSLFKFIKESIFGLLMLISIGTFLYIGIKIVTARGNPEEFKKAMTQFIYAAIGIALVSLAWAAVKLVSGLNF